ncbi:MAG: hypothetical protein KAI66_14615, partial [Lentisphaeria bacterium]|nr:hypothetical protein [Lentisphaeria bacterium]
MNDNTSTRLTGSIRKILDGRTPRGVNPADLARQYCERCIRLEVTIRDCLKLLRSNQFGELVRMVEQ